MNYIRALYKEKKKFDFVGNIKKNSNYRDSDQRDCTGRIYKYRH